MSGNRRSLRQRIPISSREARFAKEFGPQVVVTTTGLLYLLTTSIDLMMRSTLISYIIAGILISLLMILLLHS